VVQYSRAKFSISATDRPVIAPPIPARATPDAASSASGKSVWRAM
jgi:hypothetical protein